MTPSPKADHDQLTGLLNRGAFESHLRARLPNTRSALLCMDIDHLAHCNHVLGFEVVDELLMRFAQGISRVASDDFVGRTDNDEFCAFVEDGSTAPALAERLRAFAATTFAKEAALVKAGANNGLVSHPSPNVLTFSIGIAYSSDARNDSERLVEAARAAVFEAKKLGRNRSIAAVPTKG